MKCPRSENCCWVGVLGLNPFYLWDTLHCHFFHFFLMSSLKGKNWCKWWMTINNSCLRIVTMWTSLVSRFCFPHKLSIWQGQEMWKIVMEYHCSTPAPSRLRHCQSNNCLDASFKKKKFSLGFLSCILKFSGLKFKILSQTQL